MEERPFAYSTEKPTDNKLFSFLGITSGFYEEIIEITKDFKHQWNFSKRSGWMQKVFDNKKALFYFIPLKDGFKISLTIREEEKTTFLKDKDLEVFYNQIKNSKQYSEGYAMLFEIYEVEQYKNFKVFLNKLIEDRRIPDQKISFNKPQP